MTLSFPSPTSRRLSTTLGVALFAFLAARFAPTEPRFGAASAPPLDEAQAQQTTAVLASALVAAVASITEATPPGSSPELIEANSEAISMLVPGRRSAYRLLDAIGDPLNPQNIARGRFERDAMDALLEGAPQVQEVAGNSLRTVIPLTNDMHPNCVTCHTAYDEYPSGTVVGAASLRVQH